MAPTKVDRPQAVLAAAGRMESYRERRDAAIVEARDAGYTWRSIALAAGMTEMGVRRIYLRETEGGQEQG